MHPAAAPAKPKKPARRVALKPSAEPGRPTSSAELDAAVEAIARRAVLVDTPAMAKYLQEHLGQKLTAYIAGIKDVKSVGQWSRGRATPSGVGRERLRAAYHATALLTVVYSDESAQAWFFGANHALDDRAPAAVLRDAETPDEIARLAPLARAFVRGAS
jgi:hypothetical protein